MDAREIAKKYQNEKLIDEKLNTFHSLFNNFHQEVESYQKKKMKVILCSTFNNFGFKNNNKVRFIV